jgi:hypothetical protein
MSRAARMVFNIHAPTCDHFGAFDCPTKVRWKIGGLVVNYFDFAFLIL